MLNREMKKKINKRIQRLKQTQKIDDFSEMKQLSQFVTNSGENQFLKSKKGRQESDKNFGDRVNKKEGFGGAREDFDNMTRKKGRFKLAKGKNKRKGKGKKRRK